METQKQTTIFRSSCEAKYQTLSNCVYEGFWLHGLLDDIGFGLVSPTFLGLIIKAH
jgi:hypothetical protein